MVSSLLPVRNLVRGVRGLGRGGPVTNLEHGGGAANLVHVLHDVLARGLRSAIGTRSETAWKSSRVS